MARKPIQYQSFVKDEVRRETSAELAARFSLPADEVERRARETAVRFGVDPNLPPKERCLAVARKVRLADGFRRAGVLPEREPGQDDEEMAA